MAKILIIEDEEAIRNVLSSILESENSDFNVEQAVNGEKGLEMIKSTDYDLVISDIKMPKMDGLEVLTKTMELKPEVPFVMISGHGDIQTAVDCLKKGAFDFIQKPPDLNRLLTTVRNALERKDLVETNTTLKKTNTILKSKISKKYEMIGESKELSNIKDLITRVGPTDARVLITGPNGTGKELVAHQLHLHSERVNGPMVEVNCAAIPSELIESELFGHEKGAFTSAIKQRQGKFEVAKGGTIFLDEIGDMSLSAQAKVLRALQENRITRVGGEKEIKVDVRVIAATNKDLDVEIKEGRFREDLFHRLAVIEIKVPSLNDRKNDIPLLVDFFSNNYCTEHGVSEKKFEKTAMEELKNRNWTGNIRQLRNVVERLLILSGESVTKKDVNTFVNF